MEDNICDILGQGTRTMRTAAPRERRDHDTLLPNAGAFAALLTVAVLTGALPSVPARAQGGVPCTAIEDDAERLACYDRALRAPAPAATPAARAPAQTASPPAPAIAAPVTSTAAAAGPAAAPAAATTAAAPAAPHEEEQRAVSVTIVSASAPQGRAATFTASDGRTWVQTDSQRVASLPDTPFTAEIKSGAMSSTFLVPEGRGRAIRVRAADR
jgi:hypothetical protein